MWLFNRFRFGLAWPKKKSSGNESFALAQPANKAKRETRFGDIQGCLALSLSSAATFKLMQHLLMVSKAALVLYTPAAAAATAVAR